MGFTLEERERRYRVVRENMKKEGLDALIVFGGTGVGGRWNGNFTYLSNYPLIFSTALIYFPLEGAPAMFLPGENQLLDARRAGWVEDLRLSEHNVADLCRYLKSSKKTALKVGVSSLDALPVNSFQELQEQLPKCRFVEGSSAVFPARIVKSAEEIDMARRGARVGDKGWERALQVIKPGLSELQLMAEVEAVMTQEGADAFFDMLSAGRPDGEEDLFSGFVIPPTSRTFRDGDLVLLEITPRVGGYWNQIVRLVSLGEPPEYIARAHKACLEAKQRALEHLKPGEGFAAMAHAASDVLKEHGYSMKEAGSGHFAGLDLSESPMTLDSKVILEPGMLVTLHPMVPTGEWRQMFIGETYVVTPDGHEMLNHCKEEIIII